MNEQNTNLTEVEETQHLAVKQTAMDRLERLIALREKEIERQNYQNFVRDLSLMQTQYQNIQKNSINTHTNSQYATLEHIHAVKKTLSKYHFALFSCIKEQNHDSIVIEMTLTHPSGNKISTEGKFPYDAKGCKSVIQSVGSTITYARRYLLSMLLNVASKEDDKDGNMPQKPAFPEQINEIRRLMVQTKVEEKKILSYANVEKLDDICDQSAQTILHLLKDKQNKQMASTQQQTAV